MASLTNGTSSPPPESTVYGIPSVTKVFAGIMLLQLVERGKVHFTDTVEKYFPEVNLIPKKYSWSPPITLVQVATMSAGLQATSSTVGDPYATGSPSDWQKQLISALPHIEYVYEPGIRRLYSNISYSIFAAALERAAGKPYIDYVQEEILRPLGMTSTSFFVTPDLAPDIAKGYYLGEEKIDPDFPQHQNGHEVYWTPAGGLGNGGGRSAASDRERLPKRCKNALTLSNTAALISGNW
jgi:CubicO group peptidase (beta-lactamase class C family)